MSFAPRAATARRSAGTSRRAVEPADAEARARLQVVAEPQARDLVAAERDRERAFVAIVEIEAGLAFELATERRPQPLAFQRQRQQVFAAGLELGRGREHPGRGAGRAGARHVALEQRDRKACRREPPSDAEPDHTGADD